VKAHITDLMLSAPPRVRAQLSEALSIVSSHDFPAKWQSLLPHLVEKMGAGAAADNQQLLNGVLSTADSIYQRYRWVGRVWCCGVMGAGGNGVLRGWAGRWLQSRWAFAASHACTYPSQPPLIAPLPTCRGQFMTDRLSRKLPLHALIPACGPTASPSCRGQFMTDQLSGELEYSQALVKPLLACLQALSKRVAEVAPGAAAGGAAAEPLRLLLSNVQLVCSIFYSLNSPGLTDVSGVEWLSEWWMWGARVGEQLDGDRGTSCGLCWQ